MLDRAGFLRWGGTAALAAALAPAEAFAGLPTPTPIGDDAGFLHFGALGERVARGFYGRALRMRETWNPAERARLRMARHQKPRHVAALTSALGADAPSSEDYTVALPERAFATRGGALALGLGLERLLVGVYVGGVAFAADPATRLLMGRLIAGDGQHLVVLRDVAGLAPAGGLPDPLDVAVAGERLDQLLRATGYPSS